jgi:hypothetical protein
MFIKPYTKTHIIVTLTQLLGNQLWEDAFAMLMTVVSNLQQ